MQVFWGSNGNGCNNLQGRKWRFERSQLFASSVHWVSEKWELFTVKDPSGRSWLLRKATSLHRDIQSHAVESFHYNRCHFMPWWGSDHILVKPFSMLNLVYIQNRDLPAKPDGALEIHTPNCEHRSRIWPFCEILWRLGVMEFIFTHGLWKYWWSTNCFVFICKHRVNCFSLLAFAVIL